MVSQTEYILYKKLDWSYLTTFTFAATLCIYALHRLVGMKKVQQYKEKYRYHIIEKYRSHILLYAICGGAISAYLFFRLTLQNQLLLFVPAFIAVGYVLPFFGRQRRLRDFHYIKIFLIAIVWSFITVVLPIVEYMPIWKEIHLLLVLERALFIFAITIPFDIRDLQVDKHINVKTLPSVLGEQRSKILSGILLMMAGGLAGGLWFIGIYPTPAFFGIYCSYLITGIFIIFSSADRHDYFYTGLMDGMMILQFLLVCLFTNL